MHFAHSRILDWLICTPFLHAILPHACITCLPWNFIWRHTHQWAHFLQEILLRWCISCFPGPLIGDDSLYRCSYAFPIFSTLLLASAHTIFLYFAELSLFILSCNQTPKQATKGSLHGPTRSMPTLQTIVSSQLPILLNGTRKRIWREVERVIRATLGRPDTQPAPGHTRYSTGDEVEHGRYSCISPVSWWHLTLAKQSSWTNMENSEQPHCQIAYRVEALVTSQEAGSGLEWSFEMLLKCTNIYSCKSYREEIMPCLLMPLTDCDCESR
jgi:hypothetical protein